MPETKTQSKSKFEEYVDQLGIKFFSAPVENNPLIPLKGRWPANHYICTLARGKQVLKVYLSLGIGIDHEPRLLEVIESIISEDPMDEEFLPWARNCGFKDIEDYEPAKQVYHSSKNHVRQLTKLVGGDEAYQNLREKLYNE